MTSSPAKILATLISALLATTASAAPLKSQEDTRKLCEDAATALAQNKIRPSFSLLKPHWPLPAEELDALAYQTESQLRMASNRFGAATGIDFVETKMAGQSLIRHAYLVKFERHAIRYACTFYKPNATWIVNSVQWDDKSGALLD